MTVMPLSPMMHTLGIQVEPVAGTDRFQIWHLGEFKGYATPEELLAATDEIRALVFQRRKMSA